MAGIRVVSLGPELLHNIQHTEEVGVHRYLILHQHQLRALGEAGVGDQVLEQGNSHVPEYHLGHKDSNLDSNCVLTGLLIGELTNIVP